MHIKFEKRDRLSNVKSCELDLDVSIKQQCLFNDSCVYESRQHNDKWKKITSWALLFHRIYPDPLQKKLTFALSTIFKFTTPSTFLHLDSLIYLPLVLNPTCFFVLLSIHISSSLCFASIDNSPRSHNTEVYILLKKSTLRKDILFHISHIKSLLVGNYHYNSIKIFQAAGYSINLFDNRPGFFRYYKNHNYILTQF